MTQFKRHVEIANKGSLMSPDRQWAIITFQPNGYWSTEAIKVRALIIDKEKLEVTISNSMGGESDFDEIERAKAFLAAYARAIADAERVKEAFAMGLVDIDDIINHVEDQAAIAQASR